jgi:hypothetical protein
VPPVKLLPQKRATAFQAVASFGQKAFAQQLKRNRQRPGVQLDRWRLGMAQGQAINK